MSVLQFRKAAEKPNPNSSMGETVKFTRAEHNRMSFLLRDVIESVLFRDVSISIGEQETSYRFMEYAGMPSAMSIRKGRQGSGYVYKLCREHMPEITRNTFKEIYDLARDDIACRAGAEPPAVKPPMFNVVSF